MNMTIECDQPVPAAPTSLSPPTCKAPEPRPPSPFIASATASKFPWRRSARATPSIYSAPSLSACPGPLMAAGLSLPPMSTPPRRKGSPAPPWASPSLPPTAPPATGNEQARSPPRAFSTTGFPRPSKRTSSFSLTLSLLWTILTYILVHMFHNLK